MEIEKIFFFKKTNRSYQAAAAYRSSDLITMSPEMKKLRLENQVTEATVYNSFNLPNTHDGNKSTLDFFKYYLRTF